MLGLVDASTSPMQHAQDWSNHTPNPITLKTACSLGQFGLHDDPAAPLCFIDRSPSELFSWLSNPIHFDDSEDNLEAPRVLERGSIRLHASFAYSGDTQRDECNRSSFLYLCSAIDDQ